MKNKQAIKENPKKKDKASNSNFDNVWKELKKAQLHMENGRATKRKSDDLRDWLKNL